jgi:GNAT superfamily N-acetyltransferase
MIEVRELATDDQVAGAYRLVAELRPHLLPEAFVATVRRQQRDGYRLYGGFAGSGLVVAAGARDAHTLSRGPHLFVEDLVTLRTEQGKGYGTAMLRWLARHAAERGLGRLYLDSRDTALAFYKQLGFTPMTAVPCWIAVETLVGTNAVQGRS